MKTATSLRMKVKAAVGRVLMTNDDVNISFLKIKVNMMNNDVKIVVPEDKTEYDAS